MTSERGYPGHPPIRPAIPVTLATASVYPQTVEDTFAIGAELGFDGIEVMVHADPVSQSADALLALRDRHAIGISSIHSPCLLVTTRVWSTDPLAKLARSIQLAEDVGADVVVVHPPFVWQRAAAAEFPASVAELQRRTQVRIAVENMYPQLRAGLQINAYRPHWNPVPAGYPGYTLDLSHTAAAGNDALAMARQMGQDLAHVHLADGSGAARDEHLIPGRGGQPCADVLDLLRRQDYRGAVCLEVSTRRTSRATRRSDLAEGLLFARRALTR